MSDEFDLAFVDTIGHVFDDVSDPFERISIAEWGSTATGQPYTTDGGSAADYNVNGMGLIGNGSVGVLRTVTLDIGVPDFHYTIDLNFSIGTAVGAAFTRWVVGRFTDTGNLYAARLALTIAGNVDLQIFKRVNGTLSVVTSSVTAGANTAGDWWRVEFSARGSMLAATARNLTAAGPTVMRTGTDTDLRTGTRIGVQDRLETGNTNTLPVEGKWDNLQVVSPAQIRLNVNDGNSWITMAGTDFGSPQLRRSVSETMLADGDHVAASAYRNRQLTLLFDLSQLGRDAAAAQFQLLSRELDRPTNVLRYRPATTHPVFFRTFRADYDRIVWDAALQQATVRVLAEPFAYGLPETLPVQKVYNDPDAVVVSVSEDFEDTQLNITVTDGGNQPWARASDQAHAGTWSFKSGAITHSQTSDAIVTVPAGAVRCRFWYKVSSEESFDLFRFLVDAAVHVTASGEVAWTQSPPISVAGAGTVTFRYSKDSSANVGSDAAWVDDIEFFDQAGNRMFWDVADVKGDVDAATKIHNVGLNFFLERILLATRRRGTPSNVTFVLQAESATQETNTTTQPHDAAMSGPGNNFSRVAFANSTMDTRLLWDWPATATVDGRGTYRVFAACRKSVAGDTIDLRLQIVPYGSNAGQTMSTVRLPSSTTRHHVDMGLISMPFGADPVTDGPSGVVLAPEQYGVRLQAQRVSGTGNLDVDYMLFVPADDQLTVIDVGNDAAGDGYVFDSHHDLAYAVFNHRVDQSADIVAMGSMPTLRPGVNNRVYLVRGLSFATGGSGISNTADMVVTYWPRYLHVRPVTS